MSKDRLARFHRAVVRHIRVMFSTRYGTHPQTELMDLVDHTHRRATVHGFTTERQVLRFTDMAIVFGPAFGQPDGDGWWTAVLADRASDPDRRLDALEDLGARVM